ncbi:hypothetical protein E2C01_060295 [Portunus trituberculatus]|uniref:Uncharacterized protein n=1 Tax=Portunus trituberculatus TaxID=210409 RepID=A0A5B7H231_PORTR|nr:hypothetical protein [Portunus trituberculatus]
MGLGGRPNSCHTKPNLPIMTPNRLSVHRHHQHQHLYNSWLAPSRSARPVALIPGILLGLLSGLD